MDFAQIVKFFDVDYRQKLVGIAPIMPKSCHHKRALTIAITKDLQRDDKESNWAGARSRVITTYTNKN